MLAVGVHGDAPGTTGPAFAKTSSGAVKTGAPAQHGMERAGVAQLGAAAATSGAANSAS